MTDNPTHAPARTPRGFTLVEIMVALTIVSLIMTAIYQTLNTSLRARDRPLHASSGCATYSCRYSVVLDLLVVDLSTTVATRYCIFF